MYRHCVFCTADLGSNEVLETFPTGRRLAFDGHRGRLWVVCPACERWNLTPLEERWEAVEDCERLFRETPLRVSGEQVGLARHRGGLDLVRVGQPVPAEFAAWRYGDQFGRRRRKQVVWTVAGGVAVGGVAVGSMGALGVAAALQLGLNAFSVGNLVLARRGGNLAKARIQLSPDERLVLSVGQLHGIKVRPAEGDNSGPGPPVRVLLEHSEGSATLEGTDAVRALRATLPRINAGGGSRKRVSEAVASLEAAGGPEAFLGKVEQEARRRGQGYTTVPRLPAPLRLALEMAAHEETEREALEGELSWLEATWREAEEVAAIADDLALPQRIRQHLEVLKVRAGRGRKGSTSRGE
ncbi:MAG: hypothetical protein EA352_02420 [Gemmatimonadales bacterium]|nr:MAG: hypothetical protein EA352_02420 [Gemmatimonadales bacterium]